MPAIYNAIINHADPTRYDTSIKAGISGAAGLPVDIQERFQNLTGARLVEGYGLSEASPVTHANPKTITGKTLRRALFVGRGTRQARGNRRRTGACELA